jgi:hypothetical protein
MKETIAGTMDLQGTDALLVMLREYCLGLCSWYCALSLLVLNSWKANKDIQ